ncbi:MAG: PorT family protein [Bacteroidales bacterium]|jgi:hypothetical protein|nr:PorT family protein [Bacteroidales bacterium]
MHRIKITSFLILLFLSNQLIAQQKIPAQRWYTGLSVGAGITDISSGTTDIRVINSNGFVGGPFLQYQINEQFSVRVGAEFDSREFGMEVYYQGMRYTDTSTHVCYSCRYSYENTHTSYYLTFPLLLQYSQYRNKFGLTIKGGVYYSLLLISYQDGFEELYIDPEEGLPFYQIDNSIEPGHFINQYKGEALNVMNTYDAGIMLGLGGTYALNNKLALLLEGNLQVGFQGVFENPGMISLIHRAFQLRGGLIYRLTRNRIVQ